jgi:hypothetical protein
MKNVLAMLALTLMLAACGAVNDPRCSVARKDVERAKADTQRERDDAVRALNASVAARGESIRYLSEIDCLEEALNSVGTWEATQKQPLTTKALQEVITKQRKSCDDAAKAPDTPSAAKGSAKSP